MITSCSSAICGDLSINSQVQVRIRSRADEERTPAHSSFIGMDSQFSPLDAVRVVFYDRFRFKMYIFIELLEERS